MGQAFYGPDFRLLPRFTFPNLAEVSAADATRDALLVYARTTKNIPDPVGEAVHSMGHVRLPMHRFRMLSLLQETVSEAALPLSVIQLPYRANDTWLGTEFKVGTGIFHDTLSLIQSPGKKPRGQTVQLLASLARLYSEPAATSPKAWDPEKMAYRVAIATPASGTDQAVLDAPRYSEGRLDWYAFDASPAATRMPDPIGATPASFTTEVIAFLPTAADFPGMPSPRFWEMEDRQVNFGTINAKTTDHLLLTFAEMALVFGNDWFVIPLELPVNSLCEVQGLVVTDVFGDLNIDPRCQ